jgi:hypothetical protein
LSTHDIGNGVRSKSRWQAANNSSVELDSFSSSLTKMRHGRPSTFTCDHSRTSSLRMPPAGLSTTITASAACKAVIASPSRLSAPGVSSRLMVM